jgi:fucose permease
MALYAFVALGLPDGLIGTAWPSVRHSFGAPLAELGIVLVVGTAGSVASAAVAGLVLRRFGLAHSVVLAGTIGALGAVGIVVSPDLWAFVAGGCVLGMAAGFLDSSLNAAIALAGRNRLLNMLHGCYGIGTTLGPLVVTAAVLAGDWRPAYVVLAVVELLVVVGWLAAGRRAARQGSAPGAPAVPQPPRPTTSAQAPPDRWAAVGTISLGLAVFAVYTGLEVSAGQWEPSFDRGVLHLGTGMTGLATFGYWGALTVARFALAVPRRPLRPASIVRWGCLVALGGTGLTWWRPDPTIVLVGLVVVGASLAGVFPALVALTPSRVGEELAHHVIGWQIGAASVGGSLISAAMGGIFQRWGLVNFGPCLVVVAVALVIGTTALQRSKAA